MLPELGHSLVVNRSNTFDHLTRSSKGLTSEDGEVLISTSWDRHVDFPGGKPAPVRRSRQRGLKAFLPLQTVMLYNFQLYFRTGPQPLDAPPEVSDGSNVTGPGAPEEEVLEGAANAVMLMLARNSELEGAVSSVKQLEENFNRRYHYPWVFLNDEPFTEEFKQ